MLDKLFDKNVEQTLNTHAGILARLETEISRMAEFEARLAKLEQLSGIGEPSAGTREPAHQSTDICEIPEPAPAAPSPGEAARQAAEKAEEASLRQELEETAAKLEEAGARMAGLEAGLVAKEAVIAELEASLKEAREAGKSSSARLEKAGAEKSCLEAQVASLQKELTGEKKKGAEAEANLAGLQKELQNVGNRLENLSRQNEVWQKLGLDIRTGEGMLRVFADVGEPYRQVLESYYNLNDCLVFASQCGVVARLRQCWEGCRELALAGTPPDGIAAFLELALEFYNRAFPNNPCQLIQAEAGEDFDYHRQDRLGPQGRKVESLVLPGFIMPNGSIGVKALVELK